jgi:hypothetical protein
VTILRVVTRIMTMKPKYNFSNQCYNDIVKIIIDLFPVKDNMAMTYTSIKRLWLVSV